MTFQSRVLPVLVGLLLAASLCCWSYPTLYGDSGLVLTPSSDVMPLLNLEVAVNYTRVGIADDSVTAIPVRVNYGIADNVELFAVFSDADNATGFDTVGGGGKVQLVENSSKSFVPGLAVGGRVLSLSNGIDQEITNAYAVSSATLLRFRNYPAEGYRVRGHFGLEFTRFDGDLNGDFFSPFAGLSYEGEGGTSLVVDYLPRLEDDNLVFRSSTVSAALRLPISNIFAIELGGTRPFGFGDSTIYAGLMYHYGHGKDLTIADPLLDYEPAIQDYY